ncbi:Glutathione S-transferase protein [Rutstroemia sp. NJR-2017a WRK4]|nr:Glutathione S-transferase protein [Rutstroemia sp. NJR-2017a WRK4]
MVLKLYGMREATCTQRVLATLAELGVTDFELVKINLYEKEQKKPSYLALQPWGKLPLLDDDGYLVYESRAICKYLALKFHEKNTTLMPSLDDLKAYGLFEQACSIELSYFEVPAFGLWFEQFIKPMRGLGATDEAIVNQHVTSLDTNLAVYEKILSKQKYLAGDEFTLADLYHLPHGVKAAPLKLQGVVDKYPHVADWFQRIQERDSWKQSIA